MFLKIILGSLLGLSYVSLFSAAVHAVIDLEGWKRRK